MTNEQYRAHLVKLAKECFVAKNSAWQTLRSKRSRELNKAAIRLTLEEYTEFRQIVPDDQLMTYRVYDMRSVIKGIIDRRSGNN